MRMRTPWRLSSPSRTAVKIGAWTALGVKSSATRISGPAAEGFDEPQLAAAAMARDAAKAVAEEATRHRAGPALFAQWPVEQLAQQTDYWLGKRGRVTEPMHLAPGATHYAPISWEAAFDVIAAALGALDSPDEAVFYTSGRTSNEAAFVYQAFARAFGTNNLPDCSNMCHESSGSALTETIGIGKGSVSIEDVES